MLELPAQVRDTVIRAAARGYPEETCGLLVGRVAEGRVQVRRQVQARNLNRTRAHDRYELDPVDHLDADQQARLEGLDVVGVWHSHPDHPAVPSETDRLAAHEGLSYVIVSVAAGGASDLRAWRLRAGAFEEEEVCGEVPVS